MCRNIAIIPGVLFLLSCSLAAADSPNSADLPITSVSLYTSGVGYFQRQGTVDGNESETISFPIGQINDILKSLVLLDTGGGSIEPVTYAAKDPIVRQLQAFSVDLSDNPDRETLLNRVRGANVRITISQSGTGTSTSSLERQILGVESHDVTISDDKSEEKFTLNLLTATGLQSVPLETVSAVQFLDPKLGAEIRAALGVVAGGRDSNKRSLTFNFSGRGKRDVLVGYVTETPLWQTTYRLVLGSKPIVQGWANVQNTARMIGIVSISASSPVGQSHSSRTFTRLFMCRDRRFKRKSQRQ